MPPSPWCMPQFARFVESGVVLTKDLPRRSKCLQKCTLLPQVILVKGRWLRRRQSWWLWVWWLLLLLLLQHVILQRALIGLRLLSCHRNNVLLRLLRRRQLSGVDGGRLLLRLLLIP